ncbi:hypothetical protein MPTK1_6g06710 [Marchantia polymorpha subsp. ruderalis]|uniref:Uncharacterized protein n=2 Tax=Marchantia polymorpha TaxID=3197 RepID=A0AAF6BP90_MARPO|nr:hypothetical protein MARPO_0173s0016 [Marchantia polymorpha]BBN13824.1 hypothetical protein Mp_6g06710 [Marchantia polymorpha subsp. ruderalis]|eukprot:PTQ28113.1 hypothetical protein MARPO_0173s0016 [Marchantia polymorpha]
MFQNGSSSSSSSIAVSRQKVTRRREPLLAVGADKGRRTQPQLPIRPESLLATTPSALVPGPRSNTAPEKEKERTSTPLTRLQLAVTRGCQFHSIPRRSIESLEWVDNMNSMNCLQCCPRTLKMAQIYRFPDRRLPAKMEEWSLSFTLFFVSSLVDYEGRLKPCKNSIRQNTTSDEWSPGTRDGCVRRPGIGCV